MPLAIELPGEGAERRIANWREARPILVARGPHIGPAIVREHRAEIHIAYQRIIRRQIHRHQL
ncbi:hypothetical protein D3C74_254420 [compost metagenome]